MREAGVVISCDGTRAEVTVLRHSACGENCASCKGGCAPTKTVITAENTAGAKPGDKVLMEMSDKKALGAAADSLYTSACADACGGGDCVCIGWRRGAYGTLFSVCTRYGFFACAFDKPYLWEKVRRENNISYIRRLKKWRTNNTKE